VWRYPIKREVIVNTIANPNRAFRGVLWRTHGDYLVLRNASLLQKGEQPLSLDGEIVIYRGNVDFLQVVG